VDGARGSEAVRQRNCQPRTSSGAAVVTRNVIEAGFNSANPDAENSRGSEAPFGPLERLARRFAFRRVAWLDG